MIGMDAIDKEVLIMQLDAKVRVEKARQNMYKAIDNFGRTSVQAIVASVKLDKELNHYEAVCRSYK